MVAWIWVRARLLGRMISSWQRKWSTLFEYTPRPCQILVNDVDVGTIAFPEVGSWYDYGSGSIEIMCP